MHRNLAARARRRLASALVALVTGVVSLLAVAVGTTTTASAAPPDLTHVASASSQGNRSAHTVRVPTSVQAGDRLVLFLTWNSQTTATGPTGWTQIQTRNGSGITGRAWTKVATAADANALVRVDSAVAAKSVMAVSAYRGSTGTALVTASANTGSNTTSSNHTTPSVPVADPNSWLVNAWSEKSSTTATWTLPAGVTSRQSAATTGSGRVSMVVGDSGAPVATGTAAGRTATTSVAVSRSALFSVVVSPGLEGANAAPNASFTFTCSGLTCGFNASQSSDANGDPLTYAWNYGDGQSGTGVSPSHTYGSAGTRTVTLTVNDGTSNGTASQTVTVAALPSPGTQPRPNHNSLVPATANASTPRITSGEIWDIEVVGNRAFVAGGFTSLTNRTGNLATVNQARLAAFNLDTGLIDTTFRPTFDGVVNAVEASPDGTKLYVGGSFNTVNGVTKRKIVSLNPTTGAPVAGFTAHADAQVNALEATNSTVYAGGRFTAVNAVPRVGLVAVNGTTGAVDTQFDNQLSGGIGTNGTLTVQQLKLTHDSSKLLVVHTARRIDGQDRYGVGLIDTATKELLPWHTKLWEDNLQYVGGIQRIYAGDISPDDSYFVVSSGSGGDRPPINDTAIAFPVNGGANMQPLWISRAFDSIYSVAITERAVYIGGHFQWNESPTAPDPWPGLDNVGYGTGQGLAAYALGDAVVRRDHLGALSPTDGKALEWHPGSNSFEGDKAMLATSRGLLVGGDGNTKAGSNTGRVAFFALNQLPGNSNPNTTIDVPIEGRVVPTGQSLTIQGRATTTGTIARVQVEVQRGSQYLQDNLTSWGAFNTIDATLGTPAGGETPWSLPVTFSSAQSMTIRARAVMTSGAQDPSKATKKIETFNFDDLPPNTSISSPSSTLQTSTSFVLRGSANDDKGVTGVSLYFKHQDSNRYMTADGELSDTYETFRIEPDNPGAVSTTWQHEVTLPVEGNWRIGAMAVDTIGQNDTRWAENDYTVSSTGAAPTVTIAQPIAVTPPTTSPTLTMSPGGRVTFSGNASDDARVTTVEVTLRNSATRENLASDGSWGEDVPQGWYRISPAGLSAASYDWSYTMPENLEPGTYTFQVRATDNLDLTTSGSMQGRITINVTIPGDLPPNTTVSPTGTQTATVRHLDLAGTATDDLGVNRVRVAIYENDTDRYLRLDGSLSASYSTIDATLATPGGTTTNWTLPVDLPMNGDYSVTAIAVDTAGQPDPSTSGATSRWNVYPGDNPPTLNPDLFVPAEGASFTESRIFVSGRAEDDNAIARVEVSIVNASNQYMSSNGTFSTTERWISAFLNSPGSPGSNYSYTTPIIPDGAYRVRVRPIDTHDLVPAYTEVNVAVSAPAANNPPVANATVSCQQNVCTFDGRTSTDENAATLVYSWNFGNGRTGSGALPTFTYTGPGTFTPTLTVRDEYGATNVFTLAPLTIVEPTGNVAPNAAISPPTCVGLVCNFSGSTSSDPNVGDTFTYLWSFGDGSTSTSSSPSRTYTAAGTYTVTLRVTDGWGKFTETTRTVTVAP